MNFKKTILLLLIAATTAAFSTKLIKGYKVGDTIEDFKLKNIDNEMVSLSDYTDAKGFVIIFTCNKCPIQ